MEKRLISEGTVIKQGLYLIGTPLGNMSDISQRAVTALESVDFIAAEDTRVTGSLLSKLNIKSKNRLISCREHNIISKSGEIVERIKNGESCGYVTDAGMPCISDPGEALVRMCYENGITVFAVPSATAVTTALAVSGLSTERFIFEGFLNVNNSKRNAQLELLKPLPHTLIFYEAPHKLKRTLSDLCQHLGDRKIALCRELTKLYEEVLRGTVTEMIELYNEKTPKGEYVIVVDGAPKPPKRVKVNKYKNINNDLKELKGETR